jgi:hypothetical protein
MPVVVASLSSSLLSSVVITTITVVDVVRYVKHFSPSQLKQLAAASVGFSGRDVKNVAHVVELSHAAGIVRAAGARGTPRATPPPIDAYLAAIADRRRSMPA